MQLTTETAWRFPLKWVSRANTRGGKTRRVLKTLDKRGCYIKIPLTPVEKLPVTTDVVESEFLKALGGQSDTNKHNMPLQTHHRGLNSPLIWKRRKGHTTGLTKSDIKALFLSDCVCETIKLAK